MNLTRFGAAFISGAKAFVIGGIAALGSVLVIGLQTTDTKKLIIVLLTAFFGGGLKALEKFLSYTE